MEWRRPTLIAGGPAAALRGERKEHTVRPGRDGCEPFGQVGDRNLGRSSTAHEPTAEATDCEMQLAVLSGTGLAVEVWSHLMATTSYSPAATPLGPLDPWSLAACLLRSRGVRSFLALRSP
jgi:hypothetical protein